MYTHNHLLLDLASSLVLKLWSCRFGSVALGCCSFEKGPLLHNLSPCSKGLVFYAWDVCLQRGRLYKSSIGRALVFSKGSSLCKWRGLVSLKTEGVFSSQHKGVSSGEAAGGR
eukprot:5894419-Amphidinium_carterae.2